MFETVLQTLRPFAQEFFRNGKKVYLVGGAVRNLLLGRPVKDFDFTTDALPSQVQTYFRKVLPTGLQHGTVTVLFRGESYEVTTFRVDGDYLDGRRPSEVQFTPTLEEDLKRRDFTINAIALNLVDGTLVDPQDGRGDLERRLLRAIGDPGQRFDEDALRLLRLFRFAAQLDFAIEPSTLEAVGPRRSRLAVVSKERIREELFKAMGAPRPDLALGPLQNLGFLDDLFAPLELNSMSPEALAHLNGVDSDLRWSWWLTLAAAPSRSRWDTTLRALTFSNADREAVLGPPRAFDFWNLPEPISWVAKAIIEAWGARSRVLLGIRFLEALEAEAFWVDVRGLKTELGRVLSAGEPVFISDLAVGGKELMAEGVPPGPELGRLLKILQREVWIHPELNSVEKLISLVRNLR